MAYSATQAQGLGVDLLLHLLQDPDLTGQFLAQTGADLADLRAMARDPHAVVNLLDFFIEQDERLLAAAAQLGHKPADIVAARTVLAGPGSFGWDAD
ncbi:DUF3572 family protein [Paracoccus sp. (in: a-proteobacteria)]|uniref:DUF3572 family protein n=1 Tax=Paracoccus sp. TaxID=267 RepID=UPI0026DF92A7|nr:DUF3572 family protein [Paracoccus sp. (in: a-proteobacteria)]MDO5646376.1 DUF3572 family protein [Paracoccus sp. (in: a-proteobacteria)]